MSDTDNGVPHVVSSKVLGRIHVAKHVRQLCVRARKIVEVKIVGIRLGDSGLARCAGAGLLVVVLATTAAAQAPGYTVTDLGRGQPPVSPPLAYLCNAVVGADKCPNVQMVTNGTAIVFHRRTNPLAPGLYGAFYWEPGMSQSVPTGQRSDDTTRVVAMSSNGFIVGVEDSGVQRAYRWSRTSGYLPLDYFNRSHALSVNAAGLVVGQEVQSTAYRAVLWNNSTTPFYLDDLNITGRENWVFESAYVITDDGVIGGVGQVVTGSGARETHNFLLTPVATTALDRRDWMVTATESSRSDAPSNAIDGNMTTRFSTGNAQHDNQGFIVNWPGERTIGRIRLEVGPSTNDYPRTCGIWVTDTIGHVTFVSCVPGADGDVDVSFPPIPASKIEVWQWGTTSWWWSIAEFNVYRQ